jgi:tetratricopeptide (TPR) repeat protein
MSKIGFISDVTRGFKKVIQTEDKEAPIQPQVLSNENGNIIAFIERGFMALEDREWQKADEFFEQALNFDAKNAKAYLGKLMVDIKAPVFEKIPFCAIDYSQNNNYAKVCRFGNEQLIESVNTKLQEAIDFANSNTRKEYEKVVSDFKQASTIQDFQKFEKAFNSFGNFLQAAEYAQSCREKVHWMETNIGTLNVKFTTYINDQGFGVSVDGNKTVLNRVDIGKTLKYTLPVGKHKLVIFNQNFTMRKDFEIKRDETVTINVKSTLFSYKVYFS